MRIHNSDLAEAITTFNECWDGLVQSAKAFKDPREYRTSAAGLAAMDMFTESSIDLCSQIDETILTLVEAKAMIEDGRIVDFRRVQNLI